MHSLEFAKSRGLRRSKYLRRTWVGNRGSLVNLHGQGKTGKMNYGVK